MDEFAQSRGEDDLFEDDIILVEPTEEVVEVEAFTQQVQDLSLEGAPKGPSTTTPHYRSHNGGGDRGRGRGRSGRGRGAGKANSQQQSSSLLQSKYAPAPTQPQPSTTTPPAASTPDTAKPADDEEVITPNLATSTPDQNNTVPNAPTEPSTPARPPAVRGDRTATGGIKKPKLTEEELTAKLAAAKTRSENLSAAHARAEADAASFAERERAAAEKRIKDAANRKVMEGERERNRARKMAVMGGREWDAEKNEEDFRVATRGRGRGGNARSGNGGGRTNYVGPVDDDLRQYQWKDDRGGAHGGHGGRRGRDDDRGAPRRQGDHGNGGGGGGGGRQPDVAAETEFPSLPATAKRNNDGAAAKGTKQKWEESAPFSPTAGVGSWADQVEINEVTNPTIW